MKTAIISIIVCLVAVTSAIPIQTNTSAHVLRGDIPFELTESIDGTYSASGFSHTWISDESIFYLDGTSYVIHNLVTDVKTVVLTTTQISDITIAEVTLSPDQEYLLIAYDRKQVFRHSITSKYLVWSISTLQRQVVANGDDLQVCRWAGGTGVYYIYVKRNDLYVYRNGFDQRVTTTGVPGVIYNGVPDWVYEEEIFGTNYAFWGSPALTRIAYATFNDAHVQKFQYELYDEPGNLENQYPELVELRYPKSGTTNPTVQLTVTDFSLNGWTISAPTNLVSDDHILFNVGWLSNDVLLVTWTNRRQQIGSIQKCILGTAPQVTCEESASISQPNGWIETFSLNCFDDAAKCFYINNVGNWRQISSISLDGTYTVETEGDKTVTSINGYNAETSSLYYTASPGANPEQRHVYRNANCLSCTIATPEGNPCTYASASFSPDLENYALICSGPDPTFVNIHRSADDVSIREWEVNSQLRTLLVEKALPLVSFLNIDVADGYQAAVRITYPNTLDIDNPPAGRTYPMLIEVYGGPNSVRVTDAYAAGYKNYLISNLEIIHVTIDGRGSGNKGNDLLFEINNRMGTVEIEDQIAVAKALLARYSFLDATKTGIWGWSYGGYATALVLATDVDHVFKCGVSVAPVTNWIYYDSMYTERYMDTPQNNEAGYANGDVSLRTEEFKNHKFLLIHGNADDNVHYQQSMKLSRSLQKADILFEQISYPDENHALGGVSQHLYKSMSKFWEQCFD